MITDHVWRPYFYGGGRKRRQHRSECAFMNCRRPVGEHERSVTTTIRHDQEGKLNV